MSPGTQSHDAVRPHRGTRPHRCPSAAPRPRDSHRTRPQWGRSVSPIPGCPLRDAAWPWPPPGTCPHHSPPVSPSPRDPQDVSTFQCLHVPQVPRCPLCMYVAGLRSPLQPLCVPWVPGCPFGNAAWPWVPQDRSPLQCPRSPWPQLPSRSPLGPLRASQIPMALGPHRTCPHHSPSMSPRCPFGMQRGLGSHRKYPYRSPLMLLRSP